MSDENTQDHLRKIERRCREKIDITLGRIDNVPEGNERDYYLLAVAGWRATLASIDMCRKLKASSNDAIVGKSLVVAASFIELTIIEKWPNELL